MICGGGTGSTQSIIFAGGNPAELTATEEWTAPALFQQENLGQVFYNSTSNAFKVTKQSVPAGTWASGGTLNTARREISSLEQVILQQIELLVQYLLLYKHLLNHIMVQLGQN
jgi:hypothetical protein